MLTQTDRERERYEARRKAQPDENALVKVARMEERVAMDPVEAVSRRRFRQCAACAAAATGGA